MASSRKSSRSRSAAADLAPHVASRLGEIAGPSARLVVGLSGGLDSVVLLDCLHRVARRLRVRLSALHIDHGLSPNSASWSVFCRRLCRKLKIPLECVKVDVARGNSVEAAARAARYAVFSRQPCDYIVLAHHRDDQVETLLLQLLRGAGVKGLAAMPEVRKQRERAPGFVRPLLDVSREEIRDYARRRGLKWIEDESNSDVHFRRNFLRHEVLPVIEKRFPAYRTTIARAARHLAEAADVLDELAEADGAGYIEDGSLSVQGLRRLPRARARNLLRYFLDTRGIVMPGTERLEEALRQALAAKSDAKVAIQLDGAELRRFGGRLHVVRAGPAPRGFSRRWGGERRLDLPELGGVLAFERTSGRGIGASRLRGAGITVRLRQGGERLQPDRRRPRRSLKNLLQEAEVPPWLRERLPLIFHGGTLVWAPGIGIDCAFQARRGEAAVRPVWLPSDPFQRLDAA